MLEVFEDAGRYFIVMDYMPNGSLSGKIIAGKPLSLEQTVEILKPVAKAIDYAHGKGLIHRDIKPSNILFMEGDEPVLSDFGLVKSLDSKSMTTTGVAFGTPEYMAPEQILGKELTPAIDLYAFGCVAYQMLTGEVPFQGNTPFEIQEGHVHKESPDIVEKNSTLPDEFSDVFRTILAKDPEQRYSSAKEFIHELEQVKNEKIEKENEEKLTIIRDLIYDNEFSKAIVLIKEMFTTNQSPELKEVFTECVRREGVLQTYDALRKQIDEMKDKLLNLGEKEKWISDPEPPDSIIGSYFSATAIDEEEQENKEFALKWLIFIGVTIVIISVVFAFNRATDDFIAGSIILGSIGVVGMLIYTLRKK